MKKLLGLFVVLLFLISCTAPVETLDKRAAEDAAPAAADTAAQAASETASAEPVAAEPVVLTAAEELEEETTLPVLEDDTAERLAREQAAKIAEELNTVTKAEPGDRVTFVEQMLEHYNNLDSYQFKTERGTFYARGDKVRVLLNDPVIKYNVVRGNTTYRQVYMDELIFDRDDKTATGYCAGITEAVNRYCAQLSLHDLDFPLAFSEHWTKMPDEWVREYSSQMSADEEYEKYYIDNRETARITFKDGTEMYFLEKGGVPMKIVKVPLTRVTYDSLVINSVRPEDVLHRSKLDIPAMESFYKPIY
jgi:hypothetical protein